MNASFLYCVLPGGNSAEFSELESEALSRGVNLQHADLPGGGRAYRFLEAEAYKLPSDAEGYYFGDEESGHSLFKKEPEWAKPANGFSWIKTPCPMCNDYGLIGGLLRGENGYDGQPCPTCRPAEQPLRYRLVCRNNNPAGSDSFSDVYKGSWFSTCLDALNELEKPTNKWMRHSLAVLIESSHGLRMWAHSVRSTHEQLA